MKVFLSKQKLNILCIFLLAIVMLCGCNNSSEVDELVDNFVYYLNSDETRIDCVSLAGSEYDLSNKEGKEAIDLAIKALSSDPKDISMKKTLGAEVTLLDYSLDNGVLILNFDTDYYVLSNTKEVLFRAAVVRTMNAIQGVDSIMFSIRGADLYDTAGKSVGFMRADNFVDNAGDEINAYEQTTLTLYFVSEDGNGLVKENREVVYSSNISAEKLVIEELLKGPMEKGQASISADRKLNSIMVKDGLCYLDMADLSMDSLSLFGNISEELTVYSVVNSLCELPGINKVQISIDGNSNRMFKDTMPLDKIYERNLDLIIK